MQFCRKDLVSGGRGEMRKNWMDTKVIFLKEILIYEYSQLQCKSLKKVVFSEKLNTIQKGFSYGCDNLKKVVF